MAAELRDIAGEMPSSKIRRQLLRLAGALETNRTPASLIHSFPSLCWILTLRSSTGTTDALTESLAQANYQNLLRNKRIRSIIYPMALLAFAVTLLIFACATLVPIFDEMYQDFGMRLPAPTLALMNLSRFVVAQPFAAAAMVVGLLVGTGGLLWFWTGDSDWRRLLVGRSQSPKHSRQALAKAATQMAELLDDEVQYDRAIRIVAESSSDASVSGALAQLAIQLRQDVGAVKYSRATKFLPSNFLLAMGIAEHFESPQPNPTMLRELATSYQELTVDRKDWSSFIVAQGTLVLVGIAILFIVFSLFAPMVSLITSLSS